MRESLPGDPTEAGPDYRHDIPEPDYDDLMMYAEEETSFARRRNRANTPAGRMQLVLAIMRAESFLDSAKMKLKDMEMQRGCVANTEADLAEGKYDSWQPKPKPPLGAPRG